MTDRQSQKLSTTETLNNHPYHVAQPHPGQRAMIYLLNTPIFTAYGLWRFEGPLTPHTARAMLHGHEVQSAIGHAATAQLLGELLQRPVPVNRIAAQLQPGDSALVLRLTQRLPEGRVLDAEELASIPHELGWLHFHSPSLMKTHS